MTWLGSSPVRVATSSRSGPSPGDSGGSASGGYSGEQRNHFSTFSSVSKQCDADAKAPNGRLHSTRLEEEMDLDVDAGDDDDDDIDDEAVVTTTSITYA